MTPTSALVGARTLARNAAALGLSAALAGTLGLAPATTAGTAVVAAPAMVAVDHGSSAQPTVRQGSRGEAVARLQRHLGISADGIFGSGTRAAVVSFQQSRNLAADGIVGRGTWGALSGSRESAPAASRSNARTSSDQPTLRQGDRGAAVTDLQRRLGIGADGIFGSGTRGSVISFQRSKGLGADGVVGRNTWAALGSGSGSSQARPSQPATASRSEDRSSSFGDRAIAEARKHVGKPYSYGAAGPNSFDCSGYVQYVMKQLGVSLPHNSAAQYDAVRKISPSELRRGDLAFVKTDGRISHVGIYDADGYWYVARRSGTTITRQKIWTSNILAGRVS